MPRKRPKALAKAIQEEKWFKVQCLCRNRDYLALCDERADLEKTIRRFETRQVPLGRVEQRFVLRVRGELFPAWEPIPMDERRHLHMHLDAPLLLEIKKRLANDSRLSNPQRTRLAAWIEEALFKKAVNPRDKEEPRKREIEAYCRRQFGLYFVANPRPFRNCAPEDLGWIAEMFVDSIRVVPPPKEPDVGATRLDFDYWRSEPHDPGRRDAALAAYLDRGQDLFVVLDVRNTPARLTHDFERVLEYVKKLKKSGKVARAPERPRPQKLKMYMKVWDLDVSGLSKTEVARTLFPAAYKPSTGSPRAQARARTRVDRYYTQAKRWISLEWARHR